MMYKLLYNSPGGYGRSVYMIALLAAVLCVSGQQISSSPSIDYQLERYSIIPTPSPETVFEEQPTNVTVGVGEEAVMKCKLKENVTQCTWFYTELDNDFYDTSIQPTNVIKFDPETRNDCSIKFKSVKKVQEGQWLCQAKKLQFLSPKFYNTKPAIMTVITEEEEKEYIAQGSTFSPPVDSGHPPAPTAIPAMSPPSSEEDGQPQKIPEFEYQADDHIQNTRTGETATLKCRVNQKVSSCGWLMPNTALLHWNQESGRSQHVSTPVSPHSPGSTSYTVEEYMFTGDRAQGDCSLLINRVTQQDEGNWRCIVRVRTGSGPPLPRVVAASSAPNELEAQGPLIHLHLLDFPHHQAGMPGSKSTPHSSMTADYTLIALLMVGLVLFVVGAVIIFICYKKVWSKQDEANGKSAQERSPQSSDPDYAQQWFRGRNLKIIDPNHTDDFKLRNHQNGNININTADALNLKTNPNIIRYSDLDHYNQYVAMNPEFPGSIRSSASSNTTLSTMIPDPGGRDRAISFGTNSGVMSHPGSPTHNHHPSNQQVPFYEVHRTMHRPVSLYSTGHLYEEIQDKMPQLPPNHIINKQGMIVPQGPQPTTPVYTNVVEDHDGYLIPNKSAKAVNRATEDMNIPQYLAMRGDTPTTQVQQQLPMRLNNLSHVPGVPRHIQNIDNQNRVSAVSLEENQSVNTASGPHNTSMMTSTPKHQEGPLKASPPQISNIPHSAAMQRIPLPNPKSHSNQQLHIAGANSENSFNPSNLNSIAHQRTSSLPDASNVPSSTSINHAKSPSLVPVQENYDVPTNNTQVPRKLDSVPKSFNGSEISLEDIDGTIV